MYTTGCQIYPSVAADAAGSFVVVWGSAGQDGEQEGILGGRYDALGAVGSEFRVTSFTTNRQDAPSVASDAAGTVTVWSIDFQDGSARGVFGQRFLSDVIFGNGFES
jgi:hypothetical protein